MSSIALPPSAAPPCRKVRRKDSISWRSSGSAIAMSWRAGGFLWLPSPATRTVTVEVTKHAHVTAFTSPHKPTRSRHGSRLQTGPHILPRDSHARPRLVIGWTTVAELTQNAHAALWSRLTSPRFTQPSVVQSNDFVNVRRIANASYPYFILPSPGQPSHRLSNGCHGRP